MKSICIKVNNEKTTEYLLESLYNLNFNGIYFSCKKFKIYQNVIIHFKGKNEKIFLREVSNLLTSLIIDLYEKNIIKNLIKSEYFYFDSNEQLQISNIVFEDLYDKSEAIITQKNRFKIISDSFYRYLCSHHSIFLKGFATFRIKKYFDAILSQIDKSVNKFIVQKEYSEFISLLKMYVNSEVSSINVVHLIYHNYKSILLDESKNVINIETDIFDAKYLSDITFSSNDYALNTLLNIIPKKIYIHIIDNKIDEFINTIKLIFEDRVEFCSDCAICKLYRKSHAIQN